jgi:hypothetical protein
MKTSRKIEVGDRVIVKRKKSMWYKQAGTVEYIWNSIVNVILENNPYGVWKLKRAFYITNLRKIIHKKGQDNE